MITPLLWSMSLLILSLILSLFFLIIISIRLSRFSYVNQIFTPVFLIPLGAETLKKQASLGAFLGHANHLRPSGKVVSRCSNIFYITDIFIIVF